MTRTASGYDIEWRRDDLRPKEKAALVRMLDESYTLVGPESLVVGRCPGSIMISPAQGTAITSVVPISGGKRGKLSTAAVEFVRFDLRGTSYIINYQPR